jgi:hypothetical protein
LMAKKRTSKVNATREEQAAKAVRLILAGPDHARLERCANRLGLSMSSFARMAVLERIEAEESRGAIKR